MMTLMIVVMMTLVGLVRKAGKMLNERRANVKSFKLHKRLTRNKTGVVLGLNQFGSIWVELMIRGRKVATIRVVDKNPRKEATAPKAEKGAVTAVRVPYGWESVSNRTAG